MDAYETALVLRQAAGQGFELDSETTSRINRARGGGRPLDGALGERMGADMGYDFSPVRVHADRQAHDLNQALSARAFTTGHDIFFRKGDYSPGSSGGRELIAHELSHVVQQATGQVKGSGSGMTVRPAGDSFERSADALARGAASVQRDEDIVQRQFDEEEEEELQMKALQRQEIPEEEELEL